MYKTKTNKKIYVFIIALAMLFSFVLFFGVSGLVAEERKNNIVVTPLSLEGTGTYSSPYLVKSGADLNNLCAYTNSGGNTKGLYFKLTSADLTESGALEVALTEPIGTAHNPFMGVFDGNDITITGATYATNAQGQAGIFGQIKNATIQNLTVKYSSTDTTATTMGGIVASAYSSNILNCTNKTNMYNTAGDAMVAGIVGYAHNLNIENCTNEATIKCLSTGEGISSAGGIVGFGYNTNISYCKISPNITPEINGGGGGGSSSDISYRGGIAGLLSGGSTKESYNTATISAAGTKEAYAGGIIGKATSHTITNCFNRGNVSALANGTSETETVSNGQSTSGISLSTSGYTVTTDKTLAYAGGIAGYSNSDIKYCYSFGTISGGGIKKTITNESRFTTNELEQTGGNSHYDRNMTSVQTVTDSNIITTLTYEDSLYYSGINGNTSLTGTNCYSDYNNLKDTLTYNIHYNKSYVANSVVMINSSVSKSTTSGVLEDKDILSKTNASYSSINSSVNNHISACSNSYANLSVSDKNISLAVGTTYNYTTGALFWKKNHSDAKSVTPYNIAYSRNQNYSIVNTSDIKSSKTDGSDKTLPSGFLSSVWAYSSLINDGYPHLIKYYWQDGAKK